MILLLVFLLLLCAITATQAGYVSQNITIGPYSTVVIWNASAPIGDFVLTSFTGETFYVVGLVQEGTVSEALCMPSTTVRITIATKGCDSPIPGQAVEHSNCATDEPAAIEVMQTLLNEWYLPWEPGYENRFGPPRLIGPWNSPISAAFTDWNLLKAQSIILSSGSGYMCAIPTVVAVQIDMPTLNVTSECVDAFGQTFGGIYGSNRNVYSPDMQYLFTRQDRNTYQVCFFYRRAELDN